MYAERTAAAKMVTTAVMATSVGDSCSRLADVRLSLMELTSGDVTSTGSVLRSVTFTRMTILVACEGVPPSRACGNRKVEANLRGWF